MTKANDRPPKRAKTDYGVDAKTFIAVWEDPRNQTVDDMYEVLAEVAEKLGRPPMPRPIILSRAAEYRAALRKQGVELKKLKKVSPRDLNVGELADLVKAMQATRPQAAPTPTSAGAEAVLEQVESILSGALRTIQQYRTARPSPRPA